ncbi:MAG: conjugal transfer protein TrbC [Novosphingobium sp.]|jgi:type-F conjugative transfer system pilin assembly protein TrbC|nr:conjugal transfer protein TrbC [Novosphingobium sp.]
MLTCKSSADSARLVAALALVLAAPASAQERPAQERPVAKDAPPANAREGTAAQGNAALERLQDATAARKGEAQVRGPMALPVPDEATRRRAFEGLRKRAPMPAIDARTRTALDKGKEALAAEREAASRRIGQALGLDAPDMAAVAGITAPPAAKGWVPVLFASSSMPLTTLRTYAAQLERAHGVIAFRGMPGGMRKVEPMAKLTAQVLRLDPGCEGPACAMRDVQVIVDPLVFRQHGVTRVPALAMIPGDPTQPYCERDDESPRAAHVVYGDAALSGLFEEYARLGGGKEVSDAQARLSRR